MYVYICRESVLTLLDVIHAYTSMIRERESCEYVWESIIHICDMTHSFAWIFVTHAFLCVTRWFMCAFIFVAWHIDQRIHVCDRTRSHTYVTESEMTQIVYYVYTCTFNSRFCIMYLYLCICKERERTQSFFCIFMRICAYTCEPSQRWNLWHYTFIHTYFRDACIQLCDMMVHVCIHIYSMIHLSTHSFAWQDSFIHATLNYLNASYDPDMHTEYYSVFDLHMYLHSRFCIVF